MKALLKLWIAGDLKMADTQASQDLRYKGDQNARFLEVEADKRNARTYIFQKGINKTYLASIRKCPVTEGEARNLKTSLAQAGCLCLDEQIGARGSEDRVCRLLRFFKEGRITDNRITADFGDPGTQHSNVYVIVSSTSWMPRLFKPGVKRSVRRALNSLGYSQV